MAEQEGARKEARFMVVSMCPDVCKSPAAPVPYPIIGYLDKSVMVSPNVRSHGFPVFHMGSRVATVIGDEAGIGGGVVSGVNKGFCKPIVPVTSVRINGQFANDSIITYMLMNGAGPEGPFNTIGQLQYTGPMYFADVGPGGTVPADSNPTAAAENSAETGFLTKLNGSSAISDVVGMAKTGYALAKTDWSNPMSVLGAIGGVAGMGGMGGIARGAQLAQQAYGLTAADWSNPGAALGAIMGVAGPVLAASQPRGSGAPGIGGPPGGTPPFVAVRSGGALPPGLKPPTGFVVPVPS